MLERDWINFGQGGRCDPTSAVPDLAYLRGVQSALTPEQYDALIDAIDLAQIHYGTDGDVLAARESERDRAEGRGADRRFTVLECLRRALGDPGADPDIVVPDHIPDDMG